MWPFLLCVVPWVICLCLGWCGCWTLFFFLVINICTELLCLGKGIGITCSLIIVLEYLGGPEKGLAGQRPALTGWLLRRLLLLRWCCSGDSEELRLLLRRLLYDLCRCQIW